MARPRSTSISPRGVAGAQAPRAVQLAQDAPADGGADALRSPRSASHLARRSAGGRQLAASPWRPRARPRISGVDGVGGGQPGHGRQAARPGRGRSPSMSSRPVLRAEDLGQRLFDAPQSASAAAGPVGGRGVGQVEQAGRPSRSRSGPGRWRPATPRAQQVGALGILGHPLGGGLAKPSLSRSGSTPLRGVLHQPLDGALDQALEGADQSRATETPRAWASGMAIFWMACCRSMPEASSFSTRSGRCSSSNGVASLALQPAFQQPADPLAGVDGVEVLRRDAERLGGLRRPSSCAAVSAAPRFRMVTRLEFAGLGVEGLLGDPDGGDLALGRSAPWPRRCAVARSSVAMFERPAGARVLPDEDLEMDLCAGHLASSPQVNRTA